MHRKLKNETNLHRQYSRFSGIPKANYLMFNDRLTLLTLALIHRASMSIVLTQVEIGQEDVKHTNYCCYGAEFPLQLQHFVY